MKAYQLTMFSIHSNISGHLSTVGTLVDASRKASHDDRCLMGYVTVNPHKNVQHF